MSTLLFTFAISEDTEDAAREWARVAQMFGLSKDIQLTLDRDGDGLSVLVPATPPGEIGGQVFTRMMEFLKGDVNAVPAIVRYADDEPPWVYAFLSPGALAVGWKMLGADLFKATRFEDGDKYAALAAVVALAAIEMSASAVYDGNNVEELKAVVVTSLAEMPDEMKKVLAQFDVGFIVAGDDEGNVYFEYIIGNDVIHPTNVFEEAMKEELGL